MAFTQRVVLPLFMFLLFLFWANSSSTDIMTKAQSIRDGETIISSGGSFELGFFSPGNSKNRYVGIWYKKITLKTVVWVANREISLMDTSGMLMVRDSGTLTLLNGTNHIIWSSSPSRSIQNPVAQLLESGNLVIRNVDDDSPKNFLWQSFDYPGNTFLSGMKFGKNLLTGRDWYFSSWKGKDDPAHGEYTYRIDTRGYPQYILSNQTAEIYRSSHLIGMPSSVPNTIFKFNFVYNNEELYYSYEVFNNSVITRRVLSENGVIERWTWVDQKQSWKLYSRGPPYDECDTYALCGAYGNCKIDKFPICWCLDKFVPRFPENWSLGDWSTGCIRRKPLDCHEGDGFVKYSGNKIPDTRNSSYIMNVTLEECGRMCLENCSCIAYTILNESRVGRGIGCLRWHGTLMDIREWKEDPKDIYVRMALSETEMEDKVGSNGKTREKIAVSLVLTTGVLLLCSCLILYIRCKKHRQRKRKGRISNNFEQRSTSNDQKHDIQLPVFDLATIENATDKFSANNKLGEGGFGPVYKGMLEGAQEVAVKRLSRYSRQGPDEFKNEVICIAKLQHRNLVKLLGCCIQGDEKMLIYEYMPNKSLDFFIFDQTRGALLDWSKRFHIIEGIGRGLLYLHQDSRLRIIHRDLKASNVLLDSDMNPKISDFGLARSFEGNETEDNTSRVMGTYGYMSPEYMVNGIFSVKSDVFSFGILVLEIVSGKRNRGFIHHHHTLSLLGRAWKLYNEGILLELVDAPAMDSNYFPQVLRSIHVALLCVQQFPEDRPNMSSVVLMLSGEGELPQPKPPGVFTVRSLLETVHSTSREIPGSINEISFTQLDGR